MTICISCADANLGFVSNYLHCGEKFRELFPDLAILSCKRCGLQQVDHSSIDEGKLTDYYRYFYRKEMDVVAISKHNHATRNTFWGERGRTLARIAAQHINPVQVNKIFEVGAGYGHNLIEFQKQFGQARLFTDEPASKLPPQDVTLAKIEDGPYDIVIMSHVLEHFKYPKEFVVRAVNNLRRGGLLVIEVPNDGYGFVHQEKNGLPFHTGHLTFFSGKMLRLFFRENFKELAVKHLGSAGPTMTTLSQIHRLRRTLPTLMRGVERFCEFALKRKIGTSAFDFSNDSDMFNKIFLRIVLVRE